MSSGDVSSRILVIGGTGMMGQHLVNACLAAGHPTAVLIRPVTDAAAAGNPSRTKLLEAFKARGAKIVYGDMNDHESLVSACKAADVVISAAGHHGPDLEDGQLKIVAAIKEAGNIKRFVSSEFGCDVDQVDLAAVMEPARSIIQAKVRVRDAVRAAGIPHTFMCSYWAHGFVLPRLGNPEVDGPPDTTATVFGDEGTPVIFVHEDDMSTLVVKAVDDPRTLNKILYMRPPANICSLSHLVDLWEQKTGKNLDRYHMPEEELVRKVQDSPFPLNFQLAMVHATVAAARVCDQTMDLAAGVEATQLYPDFKFTTVAGYLDDLVKQMTTTTTTATAAAS